MLITTDNVIALQRTWFNNAFVIFRKSEKEAFLKQARVQEDGRSKRWIGQKT